MSVAMVEATVTYERVFCDNAGCDQVIMRRRGNHFIVYGDQTLDSKGRPVIECPKCGRFTVVRREVKGDE